MRKELKDGFLRSAKAPTAGRGEFADTKSTGLEFRITAGGVKSWSFRFRDPTKAGKPLARATIGTYPATTLKAARKTADKMREAVDAGRNPAAARKAATSGAKSFGALAKRYLKEHAERHKRSHKRDARNLELHVLPHWRDRAAAAIKRTDVIELVEGIVSAGTPTLANRIQALVSKIYSFGIDAAELEYNPCFRMAKRGVENVGKRVLSDDEIRLLWNGAVEPFRARRIGLALRLCLLTATRVGEVAGISRTELERIGEPGNAAWCIPSERTKNKKPHVIPLSPLALGVVLDLLDMIESAEPFLLPTRARRRAGPIAGNTITQAMAYFSERIAENTVSLAARTWKAEPPTPHDLRRTVETRLAELRIPKEIRDRCLNHLPSDVGSKHYNQYDYFVEKAEAFNRWSAAVEALVVESSGAVVSFSRPRRAT